MTEIAVASRVDLGPLNQISQVDEIEAEPEIGPKTWLLLSP
jgi:hypothetical protein